MTRATRTSVARPTPSRWLGMALVIAGAVMLAAALPSGWAQPAGDANAAAKVRPTKREANCTAGGCHAEQTGFKFMHGPTSLGACDTCHEYADPAKHTFKNKRDDKNLCTFCHVGMEVGKVVHEPVKEAKCLSCHNPHGAGNRQLLRAENTGKLCESCHGDVTRNRKHVHGPVGAGNCATCHNSHTSENKHLLVAQGRELCLGCHDVMGRQLASVKFVHEPAKGDCLDCHEPHASDQIMQLKQDPLTLCNSCHANVKKMALDASHKHSVVTEGLACINCHTPHGSDLGKLLKGEPIKVCLTCHDKDIQKDGKVVVPSVAKMATAEFKHGPIRDGNCSGCHNVHGSENTRLLVQPYGERFYQPFSEEAYDLCFTCHNKQLVLLPRTEGLTNFRDGDVNLHYLHVNKAERGRSCRACHQTHASDHPLHIRDSVPYGNWQMPIDFKPARNGGSCSPGCHKPLTYDRNEAVNFRPTTQPEEQPAGSTSNPTTQADDTAGRAGSQVPPVTTAPTGGD